MFTKGLEGDTNPPNNLSLDSYPLNMQNNWLLSVSSLLTSAVEHI